MTDSLENKKFKLQVFGGDSDISGLFLHTAVDETGPEPIHSQLVISKVHGPAGHTKVGTTVLNPPKPKDEFIVNYASDPAGGVLNCIPDGMFCVLEGASGRGLWTLYGDGEPEQPAGVLGWDKKWNRFMVEQPSERDFFLGVNVNTFPGSGIFVASRDSKPPVGFDRWIISWLEPGTASMDLLEKPIPIRIALVPVD